MASSWGYNVVQTIKEPGILFFLSYPGQYPLADRILGQFRHHQHQRRVIFAMSLMFLRVESSTTTLFYIVSPRFGWAVQDCLTFHQTISIVRMHSLGSNHAFNRGRELVSKSACLCQSIEINNNRHIWMVMKNNILSNMLAVVWTFAIFEC